MEEMRGWRCGVVIAVKGSSRRRAAGVLRRWGDGAFEGYSGIAK